MSTSGSGDSSQEKTPSSLEAGVTSAFKGPDIVVAPNSELLRPPQPQQPPTYFAPFTLAQPSANPFVRPQPLPCGPMHAHPGVRMPQLFPARPFQGYCGPVPPQMPHPGGPMGLPPNGPILPPRPPTASGPPQPPSAPDPAAVQAKERLGLAQLEERLAAQLEERLAEAAEERRKLSQTFAAKLEERLAKEAEERRKLGKQGVEERRKLGQIFGAKLEHHLAEAAEERRKLTQQAAEERRKLNQTIGAQLEERLAEEAEERRQLRQQIADMEKAQTAAARRMEERLAQAEALAQESIVGGAWKATSLELEAIAARLSRR